MLENHINENEPLSVQILRYGRLYAIGVFNQLDRELSPELHLITFTARDGKLAVDVFPKNATLLNVLDENLSLIESCMPNKFKDTKDLAANSINLRSMTMAVLDTCTYGRLNHLITSDFSYFDNGVSCIITAFDILRKDSHYTLSGVNAGAPKSLYDAVSNEYRHDISRYLNQISKGYNDVSLDYSDTIRRSAKELLKLLGFKGLWDTTFKKLRNIAGTKHNNSYARGKIAFMPCPMECSDVHVERCLHTSISYLTRFRSKVPLSNHRYVRRLLDITSDGSCLVCDAEFIIGVAELTDDYDYALENLFVIEFTGMNTWEMSHFDKKMLHITGEKIHLPYNSNDYAAFKKAYAHVFNYDKTASVQRNGIGKGDYAKSLYKAIASLCRDRKEATLLISTIAREESHRLSNQCFPLQPVRLQSAQIRMLAKVDGALLISQDNVCYAMGTILDGLSTDKVDHSKGLRYNAAVCYVETLKKIAPESASLAVILYEDGSIDWYY